MNRPRITLCTSAGIVVTTVVVFALRWMYKTDGIVDCDVISLPERQPIFPDEQWCSVVPEALGVDGEPLKDLRSAVGWRSVGIVIKDGYVIHKWGHQSRSGNWASASKPLFATMMLFAMQEGLIADIADPVVQYGLPLEPADHAMTWRQLVDMMGNYGLEEPPGEAWAYNDYNYLLLTQGLFGHVFDIAATEAGEIQRLITDQRRLGPLRFYGQRLVSIRGQSPRIVMTPKDYARIGWFWLNRGRWNDEQLLPTSYFDDHFLPGIPKALPRTSGDRSPVQPEFDGGEGGGVDQTIVGPGVYGFYLWHNTDRVLWPDVPEDAFQANGAWNRHAMTVVPSLGLVIAWRDGHRVEDSADTFHESMNDVLQIVIEAVSKGPFSDR